MVKIVITGSNGLLGQSLLKLLLNEKNAYQVIGFSKGENRSGRDDFEYHSIDLTDEELLKKTILQSSPNVIINAAAMTNVDRCEIDKSECDKINVELVKLLSQVGAQINAHMIHISTDFIFDGKKGNYTETDKPNPLSYYGMSKLKSEQVLINSKINYTILRTILVFGQVHGMRRSNIVLWVKNMLEMGKEITMVHDQYRAPTYVEDLAMACKISIDKKAQGIFNISSNQTLSIYKIAQQIAAVFQLNNNLIKPISSLELDQKAVRPSKTGFDLSNTKRNLGIHAKSFKEDLQRFKDSLS
jgi:dTDP-4-dehydrorhamnose reductase